MNGTHHIHRPLTHSNSSPKPAGRNNPSLVQSPAEKRPVVDGFDQVGAAIGRLQDAPAPEIDLDFPAAVEPDFHDAPARPHVEAIDVVPAPDLVRTRVLHARQNAFEIDRGDAPVPRCSTGCTQLQCFFDCSSSPLQIITSMGTAIAALAQ